jgi:hypothetical protein
LLDDLLGVVRARLAALLRAGREAPDDDESARQPPAARVTTSSRCVPSENQAARCYHATTAPAAHARRGVSTTRAPTSRVVASHEPALEAQEAWVSRYGTGDALATTVRPFVAILTVLLAPACTYRVAPPDVRYAASARCETALVMERRGLIFEQVRTSTERLHVIDLRRGARVAVQEIPIPSRGWQLDFDRRDGARYLLSGLRSSETRDVCTGALLAREPGSRPREHERRRRSATLSPFEARVVWPEGEVWSLRGDRERRLVRAKQTYGLEDGAPGVLSTRMFGTDIVYDGDEALAMTDPPSLLVVYRPQDTPAAPLLLARVTNEGHVMWTVDVAAVAARPAANGLTLEDAHVTATGSLVLVVTDAAEMSIVGLDAARGLPRWRVPL